MFPHSFSTTGLLVDNFGESVVIVVRRVTFQVCPRAKENAASQDLRLLKQRLRLSDSNSLRGIVLGSE